MKTSLKVLPMLVGALGLMIGCSATTDDDDSNGAAATVAEVENEADFEVLDRMGRPEMTNVTIGPGLSAMKDDTKVYSEGLAAALANSNHINAHVKAYNVQNTFHPKEGERDHAKALLAAGIRALDTLGIFFPNKADWESGSELAIMTDILSEDALVVDISKPCTIDTQSYFDIEREEFLRRGGTGTGAASGTPYQHTTCGGRTLNDDIIDDTLTMWINKSFDFQDRNNPRRVTDKLDRPTLVDGNPTSTFPYLGDPHADYRE